MLALTVSTDSLVQLPHRRQVSGHRCKRMGTSAGGCAGKFSSVTAILSAEKGEVRHCRGSRRQGMI